MFILVNPKTNVVVKITKDCTPIAIENGTRVECSDEVATAYFIESENTIYPKALPVKMVEVDEIPEGVEAQKFVYTAEEGFVVNENYEAPSNSDEQLQKIMEQIEKNVADTEYLAMMMDIEL